MLLWKNNLLLCPPQHCGGLSTAGQRHGQHWNWYTLIFCLGFLHISAVSVSVNMVTCPQAYSEDYQEYSDSYCVKVICFENTDNFWWFCCETETLFAFVFACCCPMCQVREALLPCHWPWHFWHLSHIHNPFCVAALLLKVERRWRQIIGRLPSEGNMCCCWVTLEVFSDACSDSTYAGHHLQCCPLMTMLAESQS